MKHTPAPSSAVAFAAAALALSATIAGAAEPSRSQPSASGAQIYQQRLPDGRVVLTDHPMEGAQVQRTWDVKREDPVAAARRSEQVRQEAQAVSDRVERRIQRQQAQLEQSESDRLRARLAELRRETEAERQAPTTHTAVIYAPRPAVMATHSRVAPGAIEWSEPRRVKGQAAEPNSPRRASQTPRVGAAPAEHVAPRQRPRRPGEPS